MHLMNFLSTQQQIRAPDAPTSLFLKRLIYSSDCSSFLRAGLTGSSD